MDFCPESPGAIPCGHYFLGFGGGNSRTGMSYNVPMRCKWCGRPWEWKERPKLVPDTCGTPSWE